MEFSPRAHLTWNIPLTAPDGFPRKVDGGLTLNRDEADWLKERIFGECAALLPQPICSRMALRLTRGRDLRRGSTRRLPRRRAEFKNGRTRSPVLARDQRGGADLQPTDRRSTDSLAEDGSSYTGRYTERLDTWATEMEANQDNFERWDLTSFWATVLQGRGGNWWHQDLSYSLRAGSAPFEAATRAVVTDEKVRSSIAERERVKQGRPVAAAERPTNHQLGWRLRRGQARLPLAECPDLARRYP